MRFLFSIPLIILGIDGIRTHHHINEKMLYTGISSSFFSSWVNPNNWYFRFIGHDFSLRCHRFIWNYPCRVYSARNSFVVLINLPRRSSFQGQLKGKLPPEMLRKRESVPELTPATSAPVSIHSAFPATKTPTFSHLLLSLFSILICIRTMRHTNSLVQNGKTRKEMFLQSSIFRERARLMNFPRAICRSTT